MKRRELIRALTSLPLLGLMFPRDNGTGMVMPAIKIPANGEYLVFYDERHIDQRFVEQLCQAEPQPGFEAAITFIPVSVHGGKTLDDVVKIYRLEDKGEDSDGSSPKEEAPLWLHGEPKRL